jgi:hypothetical protein
MKTTTYACDRCGAEDTDNKTVRLEQVGVHVGMDNVSCSYGGQPKTQYNQEWCLSCRVKTHLSHSDYDKKTVPAPTPITLEDLIREIAYDAACEALSNSK